VRKEIVDVFSAAKASFVPSKERKVSKQNKTKFLNLKVDSCLKEEPEMFKCLTKQLFVV
jgi:hypothetical protein